MHALLVLGCLAGPAAASRSEGEDEHLLYLMVIHAGKRALADESFWPVDRVQVVGLEYVHDFKPASRASLGLEVGVFSAMEDDEIDGVEVADAFLEGSIGVRGRVNVGPLEVYVGAGPNVMLAAIDREIGPDYDHDYSLGLFVHGGVLVRLNDHIGFGLDARAVGATQVELDDYPDSDADYRQLTLTFGFSP